MNHSRQSAPPPDGARWVVLRNDQRICVKTFGKLWLVRCSRRLFGGMCTPRCDTCFMSILVSISIFMAVLSLPVSYLAVRARDQAEQSFETTVVCGYVLLTLPMFAAIDMWFGLAVQLPWFDS